MFQTIHDLFHKTDYKLFQQQRRVLSELIGSDDSQRLTDEDYEALKGIQSLLDFFTDAALDEMAIPPYVVYPEREYTLVGFYLHADQYNGEPVRVLGSNGRDYADDVWTVANETGYRWHVKSENLERIED